MFQKQSAFTLAETLITVAIIGVVAAMTLPSIMQKYKNLEVETKLKRIYSMMNQAILMSEIDNGPKEEWDTCNTDCQWYYEKYFSPYLRELKTVEINTSLYSYAMYFMDGTLLIGKNNTNTGRVDFFFYPNAKNYTDSGFATIPDANSTAIQRVDAGKTYFAFSFDPSNSSNKYHYKKGFETFKFNLSYISAENLKSGSWPCVEGGKNALYCTALIELNNWKIPDDYPFKVK